VSTNAQASIDAVVASRSGSLFDLDAAWRLHPQVAIRPERFGALLYHFGTRRLSFVKTPTLLETLQRLDSSSSARAACVEAGVSSTDMASYEKALATLAGSQMIQRGPS
jgi:putative mycofactocin binding protein MftB